MHRELEDLLMQRGQEPGETYLPQVFSEISRAVQQVFTLCKDSRGNRGWKKQKIPRIGPDEAGNSCLSWSAHLRS